MLFAAKGPKKWEEWMVVEDGTIQYCIYLYGFKGGVEITEHTPTHTEPNIFKQYILSRNILVTALNKLHSDALLRFSGA